MNLLIKQLLWCWFTLHINFILFFWFCGDHGDCKYIQIHAWWVLSLTNLIWKPLCSHRLILYVGGIKAILITQNLWHCSAPTQIWIQPLLLLFIVSESLASGLLVFVTSDRCSYCVNNGLYKYQLDVTHVHAAHTQCSNLWMVAWCASHSPLSDCRWGSDISTAAFFCRPTCWCKSSEDFFPLCEGLQSMKAI